MGFLKGLNYDVEYFGHHRESTFLWFKWTPKTVGISILMGAVVPATLYYSFKTIQVNKRSNSSWKIACYGKSWIFGNLAKFGD